MCCNRIFALHRFLHLCYTVLKPFLVKFVFCMELVYFVVIVITNSSILNSALIMKKLFYCLIISYICQFKVQYNLVGFLILQTNSLYVSPALSLLPLGTATHKQTHLCQYKIVISKD